MRRMTGILMCSLLVTASLVAQTPMVTSDGPSVPSVAWQHLRLAFGKLGWLRTPGAPLPGLAAIGTLTYYAPDRSVAGSATVVIKCRGSRQYRIDVTDATGTATTIVNDTGGIHTGPDGKSNKLPASSAVSMRSPWFPFLLDALNLDDPGTVVSGSGPLLASGLSQQIRAGTAAGQDVMSALRARASNLTISFDANEMPARIDFVRVAADNHYVTVPFSLLLSDYRSVGNIAVAFRQEEQLDEKTMSVLTLESVVIGPTANVGDADFKVSTATVTGGAQ